MKKIGLLLAVMLITWLPMTSLAEGEPSPSSSASPQELQGTDSPEESTAPAVTLSIDNSNVYDGMDKAYKDGYTPTVKDGVATVVVPLVADGGIKNSIITVTPGLGDTASSPFVFKNYQKTVSLQNNTVNGGTGSVSSYLVSFSLPLTSGRINGVYPVTIDVQGTDISGNALQQAFTSYVTVTDGKDPDAETTAETTEKPESQPKIIVSSYSINPSTVEAGGEFLATVTLENTNKKKYVQNMTVAISCESPNFTLLNDSDVIYINKLGKGATTDIQIKYKTDLNTAAQKYNIMLTMTYDNSDAATLSSTGTIPVSVIQPLRVEMTAPVIAEQVNAGDTMPLSFQVMNMGRSAVYNVRVELSAPGLIPAGTAFIGNLEAGTASEADMNVFIGTKNMSEGYEGDDKYGYTNGTITLIYEDADGKEYKQETEFSTTINAPVISASSNEVEEKPETASQWWISVAIGVVIVGSLVVYLIVRGKRKGQENADF
jgi:hypothetical protein